MEDPAPSVILPVLHVSTLQQIAPAAIEDFIFQVILALPVLLIVSNALPQLAWNAESGHILRGQHAVLVQAPAQLVRYYLQIAQPVLLATISQAIVVTLASVTVQSAIRLVIVRHVLSGTI